MRKSRPHRLFTAFWLFFSVLVSGTIAEAALTLPADLMIIEEEAFMNDTSVTGLAVLPDGVQYIGENAFSGTESGLP